MLFMAGWGLQKKWISNLQHSGSMSATAELKQEEEMFSAVIIPSGVYFEVRLMG